MFKSAKAIYTALAMATVAMSANAKDNTVVEHKNDFKPSASSQKLDFTAQKRATALNLAGQYQHLSTIVAEKINKDNLAISWDDLQKTNLDLTEVNLFNQQVISAKGFDTNKVKSLVELRLADQSMVEALKNGQSPLFAFEPKGNEASWSYIEAFDTAGTSHLLSVEKMPTRPVFVIDIDSHKDMKAGIELMRSIFAKMGQSPRSINLDKQTTEKATYETKGVLETSQLKKISVKDDQEPWISGKAEMYAIVTGIDASRADPILDVVDMPYLDHKDTNYYPNQIMIYWERYRWNAADMTIMEQDDNTNYQDLAIQLANTAASIMRLIPDPTVQGLSVLGTLTAELIKAMPSHWFSNDDDYVDTFYTIQKGVTYTNRYGAGANARMNMSPLNLYN